MMSTKSLGRKEGMGEISRGNQNNAKSKRFIQPTSSMQISISNPKRV